MVGKAGKLGIPLAGDQLIQANLTNILSFGYLEALAVELASGKLRVAMGLTRETVVLELALTTAAPRGGHFVNGTLVTVWGGAHGLMVEPLFHKSTWLLV